MIQKKELKTIQDFENLKSGDYVACEFHRDIHDYPKEYRFKIFPIVKVKKESKEVILQKKNNIYFNYDMFVNGESNLKSAILIKTTSNQTRQERIDIVNELIKEIASCGRNFFSGQYGIAEIYQKNNRLYMTNEYNGYNMCINTKNGYPPKKWHHGGTLWGLTKDFKEFIMTGEKTNGNNGYGGLYSKHWGYSEGAMFIIVQKAKSLGYL